MHHDSGNFPSKPMVPWQKVLGISISCLGLWSHLSANGLAQSINPDIMPSGEQPTANPAITSEVNIDQIVLPPADDVPEEILRTEIIFEARSPLDGAPLSPADYAQLQSELCHTSNRPHPQF